MDCSAVGGKQRHRLEGSGTLVLLARVQTMDAILQWLEIVGVQNWKMPTDIQFIHLREAEEGCILMKVPVSVGFPCEENSKAGYTVSECVCSEWSDEFGSALVFPQVTYLLRSWCEESAMFCIKFALKKMFFLQYSVVILVLGLVTWWQKLNVQPIVRRLKSSQMQYHFWPAAVELLSFCQLPSDYTQWRAFLNSPKVTPKQRDRGRYYHAQHHKSKVNVNLWVSGSFF